MIGRWSVTEAEVEAVQITPETARAIAEWCGGWATDDCTWSESMSCYRRPDDGTELACAMFPTWDSGRVPGGVITAYGVTVPPGDWIVLVEGRHTHLDDATFRSRYHGPVRPVSAESDALVAAWDGQPAEDLHADITEIIAKVGIGAENPTALAEEIAYVVMQHGRPIGRTET